MKEYVFTDELNEKAFEVYSNNTFTFYKDEKGVFWGGYNPQDKPFEIGDVLDVEEFLMDFATQA